MGSRFGLQECIKVFPHVNFDIQTKQLLHFCRNKENRDFVFSFFRYHPLLKIHDIARACYLLIALEEGQDLGQEFLKLTQEESGAVRLFCCGGFPWKGLPYPGEHAELGLLLLQIEKFYDSTVDTTKAMGAFQQAGLTHEATVFPSLWCQEKGRPVAEKTAASKSFLYQLGQQIFSEYRFLDAEIGFWMQRTRSFSAFVSGSGCKSGVGAYYFGDVGVVNYGPCYGDVSDCLGFGLSGVAKEFVCEDNGQSARLSFLSSISLPHSRYTGFSFLQDAYLGSPIRFTTQVTEERCVVHSLIEKEYQGLAFSVFCKGRHCHVVGGPRLRSSSLDSYKGPANDVIIQGERDSLRILSSAPYMEIFSLQGRERFWGSNFLIHIPYKSAKLSLVFERSS